MSQYKPYPAYKDSGVEWLGRVPEHWQVKRLKFIANVQTGVAKGKDNVGKDTVEVPYLRVANVQDGYLSLDDIATIEIPREDLPRYSLRPGDVLMNEGGDFDKLGRGHIWQGEIDPCIHQNHVFAVRPAKISPYWLNAFTGSQAAQFYFMGRSKQSTNLASISSTNVMELPVVLPPQEELSIVLGHLDRETARIDALVEKKTRFIELLREKRQALITHAVTKGLNPKAKMKDSGVEWLGEVPEHWSIRSFKHLAGIRYGIGEPPAYKPEGTPLIRATNVDAGFIQADGLAYVDPADIPEKRIVWLSPGDIIVVRSGAYTGDSAIIRDEHCPAIAGFDMVVSTYAINPDFLQYALLSQYLKFNQIDLEKMRAAQPHLNAEELGSCFVLVPPEAEQQELVDFLDQATKRIDSLISKTNRSNDLLKERRVALITAAVTGQIDRRESA